LDKPLNTSQKEQAMLSISGTFLIVYARHALQTEQLKQTRFYNLDFEPVNFPQKSMTLSIFTKKRGYFPGTATYWFVTLWCGISGRKRKCPFSSAETLQRTFRRFGR
jgi:hypothetical protein